MAEVLDRLGTSVLVDVSATTALLHGAAMSMTGFSPAANKACLAIVSRAILFEAAFDIIGKIHGYRSEVDLQKLIATVSLNEIGQSPERALEEQTRRLELLNTIFSGTSKFEMTVDDYHLTGAVEVDLVEMGSAHGTTRFTLNVSDVMDVSKQLVAGLLLFALTVQPGGCTISVRGDQEPVFVCSINTTLTGNMEKLIDEAIGDLVNEGTGAKAPASVTKARQLCLYRLGFYQGKIDGIHGRKTREAEKAFAETYGVQVNWNSRVFARFVLMNSNSKYQSELVLQNSKATRRSRR